MACESEQAAVATIQGVIDGLTATRDALNVQIQALIEGPLCTAQAALLACQQANPPPGP